MSEASMWESATVKTAATADPAAGASPAAITVPAGKRWKFLGGCCYCDTSADAANRFIIFSIKHDGTNISFYNAAGIFVATEDVYISLLPGVSSTDSSGNAVMVVGMPPDVELPAGAVLQLTISALHANDNCGPLYYAYKELPL